MPKFDLVIRNARLATAAECFVADLAVAEGRIVALGEGLPEGREEIDASGLWLTPGGIDSHCHLDQVDADGTTSVDGFASGSLAAACGGTTTIIPFAQQHRGESLREVVDAYHARAEGQSVIDYAFHLIITDPTETVLGQELPSLAMAGITSFKVYMTYEGYRLSDGQVLDVLDAARREGAMTMVHAENADAIDWLTDKLEALGCTRPVDHAAAHPQSIEREATHRAITLAELAGVALLIVHISGGEVVREVARARLRGLPIYAETCPQYLFLTEADLDLDGFEGAKCVCTPPPRDPENQEALWAALSAGLFDTFSSDHSAYLYGGAEGKKRHGEDAPFRYIPNGVPGIETRMPLLFSEGVIKGRIDLPRFVELTATTPARLYGLHPRKGTLAIGADADLVLWDPEARWSITNDDLHHACDYTPYEGRALTGRPKLVFSRGELVVRDGEPIAAPGRGRFLPCDRPFAPRDWCRPGAGTGSD